MLITPPQKTLKRKGFTLIELMVVISIISLLSSIVTSSLSSARKKARDANRISDIKQIQNALELYYSDYGYYPKRKASTWTTTTCDGELKWCDNTNSLKVDLSGYYKLPTKNGDGFDKTFYYKSSSGNSYQTYGLMVLLDGNSSLKSNDGGYYSSYYEVGLNPSYCMNNYTDGNRDWWDSASVVCKGGN